MNQKTRQSRPCDALKGAKSVWSALMLLVMMLTANTAMAQTESQVVSIIHDSDTTYYSSFEDAVNAISDGDTLTLLQNLAISNYVDLSEGSFTINLNGYTLDGKYTDYKMVWDEEKGDYVTDENDPYDNFQTFSVQSNLTIKNGTLKANISNYSVGFTHTLTFENATLYGRELQWMANGDVTLQNSQIYITHNEGYGSFSFESIAIDTTSKVSLTGVNSIGCYGSVPGGYKSFVHRITLPEGYMFKQLYSDQNLAVVSKDEPEYAANMTGITFESDGATAPGECRDFKYTTNNKHNDDYTSFWTDYDYCCLLCFAPDSERSICWDNEQEGYNCIHFVVADNEEYYDLLNNVVGDPNFTFLADKASYTRKTTNKFETLVLPFNVAYDSIKPYELYTLASLSNDTISLNKVEDTLAPGLPVLVKIKETAKDSTEIYTLSLTSEDVTVNPEFYATEEVDGMLLNGTYNMSEITEGYILTDNVFSKVDSLKANDELWDDDCTDEERAERIIYNDPFRAYLTGSMPTNPNKLAINWGEDDRYTAVKSIEAITSSDAQYYDINGRRIPELQKGINIVKRGNKTYKVIIR